MEFQIIQHSVWEIVMIVAICLLTIGAAGIFAVASSSNGKYADKIVNIGGVSVIIMLLLAAACGIMSSFQTAHQNEDSFSRQLMNEYHAQIKGSWSDVMGDLYSSKASANAVLTRDGKDTPVFIKVVDKDDKKITVEFIVLDDKSFYPKPAK